jgi:putative restriction endonuclease
MSMLKNLIGGLPENHIRSLEWFEERSGQRVSWAEMKEFARQGDEFLLSSSPKGIYKPAYTDFTLSVKLDPYGPYPDKDIEYRPDGSWVSQYCQEYKDPDARDSSAGNRGLMLCMERRVPVGVLEKRQSKPRAEYDVIGVGLVTSWDEGYFTIESLSESGNFPESRAEKDAARSRLHLPDLPPEEIAVDVYEDLRDFQLRSVAMRRGQSGFRKKLLSAYKETCCISGCDVAAALEAAHIAPYMGEQSNVVTNGLLLRSDLHTLFDLGLLSIDESYRALLAPELMMSSQYSDLSQRKVSLPKSKSDQPDVMALSDHRRWAGFAQ